MRSETRRRTFLSSFLVITGVLFIAFVFLSGSFNDSHTSAHAVADRDSASGLSVKAAGELVREKIPSPYSEVISWGEHEGSAFKMPSLGMRPAAPSANLKFQEILAPTVAPPNDLCSGAEVIPGAGPFPVLSTVTADVTDATTTSDPPAWSCGPSAASRSRSIWYSFTPATSAYYVVSTCADSPTGTTLDDTVMSIYTSSGGCGGTLTEIPTSVGSNGCDDDGCGAEAFQSVIGAQLTGATQYFVVIWKSGASAPTAGNTGVQVRIAQPAVPGERQLWIGDCHHTQHAGCRQHVRRH